MQRLEQQTEVICNTLHFEDEHMNSFTNSSFCLLTFDDCKVAVKRFEGDFDGVGAGHVDIFSRQTRSCFQWNWPL